MMILLDDDGSFQVVFIVRAARIDVRPGYNPRAGFASAEGSSILIIWLG
jgi:hypothetical protein